MKERNRSIEIILAWRNVWKNRRRTVLTLLTIMVGCSMIIFMRAWQEGGQGQMVEDAIALNAGHIQVHEKGFWREESSIDYAFRADDAMLAKLRRDRDILGFSRRIHAAGLFSKDENTFGAAIQAVEPDEEKGVSVLHRFVLKGGRYLSGGDDRAVVMGHILAKNLGASVGDKVSMISQGFDGSIASENYTVVGLFRSGSPEYDRSLVLMPFGQAREIFKMMGYVNSIAIRCADPARMDRVRDRLRGSLDAKRLEIMGWDELMPELVQHMAIDRAMAGVFYFILFTVVSFGVLNTIQMSVYERTRELGVMLAIGTGPGRLLRMVLWESALIAVMGITLGAALGSAAGWYFAVHPIVYAEHQEGMTAMGVVTNVFPAKLGWGNVLTTSLAMFILALLFTVMPARRAAGLRPIDAIRQL